MSDELPVMGVEHLNRVDTWGSEPQGTKADLIVDLYRLLGSAKYSRMEGSDMHQAITVIGERVFIAFLDSPDLPPMLKEQAE